ncbi:sigma-E factor regulatory protein RseB domain-containing protein [Bacillus sp. 03113]|uniref:sigma-E factor regulatory protein RseB domain-containing protein n=1 Tax=Bacillus sp. 03113 TaxID=2578211 RepID=UPI0015E8B62D|nr:sigma-E factor regulatory protein RseB domain-containing protein [Bacillus sp. 03113]
MVNKLNDLKNKMNETVLNDIRFEEKHKQHVLRSLYQKEAPIKKGFRPILSAAIATIMFLGIASYLSIEAGLFNGKTDQQSTETQEKLKSSTIYTPPKQEEYTKDMTKKEILTKMINSVDYFDTAKGKFEYVTSGSRLIVDYELSLNHKPGGYSKVSTEENGKSVDEFIYYGKGYLWGVDHETRSYIKYQYVEEKRSSTLQIEDAFSIDQEGIPVTNYRERPPIGVAQSSLFPYEIASNYTRDLNTWEIEKQNEELLDHNTVVLKGNVNKHRFQSFRFWVDKDSGILVKYETYDSNGEIVDYLHPLSLEVNVPVHTELFTPKLEIKGFLQQKVLAPGITSGDINAKIPYDLKEQWEQAKQKPNETTILQHDKKWYIYTEKGYIVDRIEVNNNEGTVFLVKASPQKAQFNIPVLAEGYEMSTLKIHK